MSVLFFIFHVQNRILCSCPQFALVVLPTFLLCYWSFLLVRSNYMWLIFHWLTLSITDCFNYHCKYRIRNGNFFWFEFFFFHQIIHLSGRFGDIWGLTIAQISVNFNYFPTMYNSNPFFSQSQFTSFCIKCLANISSSL